MPSSQQPLDGERRIVEEIRAMRPGPLVIDIGTGEGKWGKALKGFATVDGIEVWPANADKAKATGCYRKVYVGNATDFTFYRDYGTAILGDVLEHMAYPDAVVFVEKLKRAVDRIYLTIPVTECIQDGTRLGNPYETHLYQWSDKEIRALGFKMLHVGANPNGLVAIGTYKWEAA